MSQEYDFESLTREEAAAMLYRLADGVAVGSVALGDESIAIPDQLAVEIERENGDGEREIEVELEWPLSVEDETDVAAQDERDRELEVPEDDIATEGEDVDPAVVEDSPVEAAAADEPGVTRTDDPDGATGVGGAESHDAPSPTSVVEPGQVAESGSNARFELFEDTTGEWRWRLVHDNGNIIADSGEGYSRKANAKKGLRSVQTNAPAADIIEE